MSEEIVNELEVVEDETAMTIPSGVRTVVEDSTSLVVGGGMPAIATMDDDEFENLIQHGKQLRTRLARIHQEVMKEGIDYGTIQGTKHPTLYKPGAEILFRLNACTPVFRRQCSYGDGVVSPPIIWDTVCFAENSLGQVVAEGSGSCNSWEVKYRYRSALPKCPSCQAENIRKSNIEEEFYCWKKKDGCGAVFPLDDKRITSQPSGKAENPDPYENHNTLKKMADKRAQVACALNLGAASGSFTQDVEDMSEPAIQRPGAAASREASPPTASADFPSRGQLQLVKRLCKTRAEKVGMKYEGADVAILTSCVLKIGRASFPGDFHNIDQLNALIEAIGSYTGDEIPF